MKPVNELIPFPIRHVYGKVAHLPWEHENGIEYQTKITPSRIGELAENINVIYDRADSDILVQIQEEIPANRDLFCIEAQDSWHELSQTTSYGNIKPAPRNLLSKFSFSIFTKLPRVIFLNSLFFSYFPPEGFKNIGEILVRQEKILKGFSFPRFHPCS